MSTVSHNSPYLQFHVFTIHDKCMYTGCYCVNNIRKTKMWTL